MPVSIKFWRNHKVFAISFCIIKVVYYSAAVLVELITFKYRKCLYFVFGMKSISAEAGKSPWLKKASRKFNDYICYFKWYISIKNRGLWKVLEQIRALYANKDGHYSYIDVAFWELHSEKQPLEENTQNIFRTNIFRKIILIFLRKKVIQVDQVMEGD